MTDTPDETQGQSADATDPTTTVASVTGWDQPQVEHDAGEVEGMVAAECNCSCHGQSTGFGSG